MMNQTATTPVVVAPDDRGVTFTHHARTMVLHHGEKILTEIPKTMRRVALLLLVLSISIPVFLVGLLVVLWRLG
jgi:hypothetical protein